MSDTNVDQTIQWARESLQRRRTELHQKKKKEEEDQGVSYSLQGQEGIGSNDVNSILERGRALLKQAESHSQTLGQYTARMTTDSKDQGDKEGNFMARFLQAADEKETLDSTNRFADIPVDRPSWNNRFVDDNDDSSAVEPNLYQQHVAIANKTSSDLEELLKEGEARVRLDNLVASIRRQGDDPLVVETQHKSATPSTSFDLNGLRAAKRAAFKKTKFDEALAESEMQAKLMSNFKALPLPGGAEVKNDLFKPTKAFQGKHRIELVRSYGGVNDFSTSQSLGGFESLADRMSVATSRTSIDMNSSFMNEEDKERAIQLRQAKKAKKKKLLDSVNRKIAHESGESFDDDVSIAYSVRSTQSHVDYLEDPSKLRREIARLEAKLKCKKSQRTAILNDIVDVDLNAIFERLLSEDTDENARKIVDRIKHKVCGNVVDGLLADDIQPLPRLKEHHPWNEEEKASRGVLYERQENWIRQREQKLLEARLRIEAEEMSDITGKPRLNHANDSWKKAKDAHDEALKRIAEEQARRQKEKKERERIEYEAKMKEAKDIEMETKAQMKSVRNEVNKEEQMKRLEKLSQPRQIKVGPTLKKEEVGSPVDNSKLVDEADTPYKAANNHKSSTKKAPKATNEYVDFSGKKFSDMDDKEFAKIVKRISKMAKQKVKDAAATIERVEDSQPSSPKFTIIGNPENILQPIEFATGKFYASEAQARFLRQLSNDHS